MQFLGICRYIRRYQQVENIQLVFLFFILQGDNWGPTWLDWRHHGPPHWLLNSQWGWDYLLFTEVSFPNFDHENFIWSAAFDNLSFLRFFTQGPQSWGHVCCQEEIWKSFDKEGLELEYEYFFLCSLTLHSLRVTEYCGGSSLSQQYDQRLLISFGVCHICPLIATGQNYTSLKKGNFMSFSTI